MTNGDLRGRIAFITGSGRGLGRAIADRLAELGVDIGIHDLSEDAPAAYGEASDLESVAAELRRHGGRVLAVTGPIADESAVGRMAREVESGLGPVDILVNCAGGDIGAKGTKPQPNTALEIPLEDVRAIIDGNFVGTLLACRAFCPGMVARRRGSVVNIASVAAHFGTSPEVVYSSVKAAIVHFTRCLAFELRPAGVRVNAVSPGPTKTARFLATRKVQPEMMDDCGLVRYGNPRDVADAVAFLAGDASRFVSGQILRVDGGMCLYAG